MPKPQSDTPPPIPVGILGATGAVGQRFVSLLARHPWFEIHYLAASSRSAGRPYDQAASWMQEGSVPLEVTQLEVEELFEGSPPCRLLFSALDASVAGTAEERLAEAGHFVVSNARNHRLDPDVPLIVPEVNPQHLDLLENRVGEGAIVTNPNCSTIGLSLALAPLELAFGIESVRVTTLQALSGAGLPGVPALQATDNVVPHIGGEEEKLESETSKILGQFESGAIRPAGFGVSAQCNRVPVIDGHTLCLSVQLGGDPDPEQVASALRDFRGLPQALSLPSAPARPIEVLTDPDRPQPRLDRARGNGMTLSVGRLRRCPLGGVKMVALSHNTIRGAAGGSILLAELALARGLVPEIEVPRTLAA